MRRWLKILVLFAGASVVNIGGVALSWASWQYDGGVANLSEGDPTESEITWWRAHAPSRFPAQPALAVRSHGVGWSVLMLDDDIDAESSHVCMRHRRGWPLQCVEARWWMERVSLDAWRWDTWGALPGTNIPCGIRPVQCAANVLFFAAALFALSGLARWLIRQRRIAADLCPSCRYPSATASDRCAECGTPIRRSRDSGIMD